LIITTFEPAGGQSMLIIEENMLDKVIATLKQLDVRGFDSMDKLVGVVLVLENVKKTPHRKEEKVEEG
jgi:hypothetical protein